MKAETARMGEEMRQIFTSSKKSVFHVLKVLFLFF